jgi:recombination protein RecA
MPPRKASGPRLTDMDKFRAELTKQYGTRIAVPATAREVEYVSTGSLSLDVAMRRGGLPRGRIIEFVGQKGSAKTTTVITSLREQQRAFPDLAVCYIDMEQTFDYPWAEANGLDTDEQRFVHVFPRDSEDVADLLRVHTESALFSAIAVDSIGGMESRLALEKGAIDTLPGRNAQVITRMVKVAATTARLSGKTILLVNQFRANIGGGKYSPSEVEAGPKALGYATTVQLVFRRTSEQGKKVKIDGVEEEVGRQFRVRVARAKTFAAGRTAEFWLLNQPTEEYGPVGIWAADEVVEVGERTGTLRKRENSSYYDVDGLGAINGQKKLRQALSEHPEVVQAIRAAALTRIGAEDAAADRT